MSAPDDAGTAGPEAENRRLRDQLTGLLAEARNNEAKLRRLERQELALLALDGLPAVVRALLRELPREFGLSDAGLTLVDPGGEAARLLAGTEAEGCPGLTLVDDAAPLVRFYGDAPEPRLAAWVPEQQAHLHPLDSGPASVAFLPLVRGGRIVASLVFASDDPERFLPGYGTDFLRRLAAVVGVCLENALNHERLARLALSDPLTELNNRRFFDQRLSEEVLRARRHGVPLACLLIDIDHFKSVNDRYGHPAGDRVLRQVAGVLRDEVRGQDVLARYGGEEFAVLLDEADADTAHRIAERIRVAVVQSEVTLEGGDALPLTASVGAAVLAADAEGDPAALAADLVARADAALYEAKGGGRNRVVTTA